MKLCTKKAYVKVIEFIESKFEIDFKINPYLKWLKGTLIGKKTLKCT